MFRLYCYSIKRAEPSLPHFFGDAAQAQALIIPQIEYEPYLYGDVAHPQDTVRSQRTGSQFVLEELCAAGASPDHLPN